MSDFNCHELPKKNLQDMLKLVGYFIFLRLKPIIDMVIAMTNKPISIIANIFGVHLFLLVRCFQFVEIMRCFGSVGIVKFTKSMIE